MTRNVLRNDRTEKSLRAPAPFSPGVRPLRGYTKHDWFFFFQFFFSRFLTLYTFYPLTHTDRDHYYYYHHRHYYYDRDYRMGFGVGQHRRRYVDIVLCGVFRAVPRPPPPRYTRVVWYV